MTDLTKLCNGQSVPFDYIDELAIADFRTTIIDRVANGCRVSSMFGIPDNGCITIVAVIANDDHAYLEILRTHVNDSYESITPIVPQVHWFEREIAEQWGVIPTGHPWLKPIRFHNTYRIGRNAGMPGNPPPAPGVTDYFRIAGDEIHQVAVGPVHAGVIEPGHFRFQCHGENVFHLEIELGYQHRGIEQALVGGPDKRTGHYMETLAGDTSIGHSTAYAMIMETLAGASPSHRSQAIRAIALELERMANHTGDLGAMAGDVGFLPTASYCGRLRGDFLNITALLCGNRFGRNLIMPGGVRFDLDDTTVDELRKRLDTTFNEVQSAVNLMWDTPSVMTRFTDTGIVTRKEAASLGLVGPVARASCVPVDVRDTMPWGVYTSHRLPSVTMPKGDVHARASMRWFEICNSKEFIVKELDTLTCGPIHGKVATLAKNRIAVALVEGWRGEICHTVITDQQGRFRHYKIVDPSFHNWYGLAMALRNQQISDFPLCNKSFNLSYCGHDL